MFFLITTLTQKASQRQETRLSRSPLNTDLDVFYRDHHCVSRLRTLLLYLSGMIIALEYHGLHHSHYSRASYGYQTSYVGV